MYTRILEGDAVHRLELLTLVHLRYVRHHAIAREVQHGIFVDHAAVRQLSRDGVVHQRLGVFLVGNLHRLDEDLILHRVECVQRDLHAFGLVLVAPERIGDVDAAVVICHGGHGGQQRGTQEQSKQFLHGDSSLLGL